MPVGMFFGWVLGCPDPEISAQQREEVPVEQPRQGAQAEAPVETAGKPPSLPALDGVTLPPMGDVMSDHFVDMLGLVLGVMGGDLKSAQQAATRLTTIQPDPQLPPTAAPFFEKIRASAGQAAAAPSLPEAANATAGLLVACGECHAATGGGPKDTIPEPPAEPHMGRHVFGAYWMAYGLFAPDERAWAGGTQALANAPLAPEDWKPAPGQEPLDQAVHAAARQAAQATDPAARAAAMGQLLATCAPCHQQLPR